MPDRGGGFLVEISDGASGTFYPDCQAGVTNTLYVATSANGGNDANDGISPSRPLATVAGALARIDDLGGECEWIVSVGAGQFTNTSPMYLTGEVADRITIKGAATTTTAISAVTTVTPNGSGSYTIAATVGSTAGWSNGDLIAISASTAGSGLSQLYRGTWEVQSVIDGTHCTFKCYSYYVAPPSSSVTGTIIFFPTQLRFTACSGVVGNGGTITEVALKGDRSTHGTFGIRAGDPSGVPSGTIFLGTPSSRVAVANFGDDGVRADAGSSVEVAAGCHVFSSNNGNNGALARAGGTIIINGLYSFTGNGWQFIGESGGNGAHAQFTGHVYLFTGVCAGNWGMGYLARNGGSLICDATTTTTPPASAVAQANDNNYQAGPNGGSIQCAEVCTAAGAHRDDFHVEGGGSMIATGGVASTAPTRHGFANFGGYLDMTDGMSTSAGSNGVHCANPGTTIASGSNVSGAANIQYHAETFAYMERFAPAGSSSADPAINTLGNVGAYIRG